MKGEKKKARDELDIVNVIEWRCNAKSEERWFLLVKRPKGGKRSYWCRSLVLFSNRLYI
jgi:A/G-specific adenine glycosylase